jgi:hypothetical protein
MSRRTVGPAGIRSVAAAGSVSAALTLLATSPYARDVRADQDLAAAQRAVASTLLWNIRVLAGWTPSTGVSMLRAVVAWYELMNIEDRLRTADAEEPAPPFDLGGLATSWRRLADAPTAGDLRDRLATTPWGPTGDANSIRSVGLVMRARLLERTLSSVPGAEPWSSAAAALIVAREQLLTGQGLPSQARRSFARVIGDAAIQSDSLDGLRDRAPASARWVFEGIGGPDELWRAEWQWWSRVEHDGAAMLRGAAFDAGPIVGAVAVMAADAWRVRGALEIAARGGRGREVFDALA